MTTQVWIKAHPPFTSVNSVIGTITANSTSSYNALISEWWTLQPTLVAQGWSGISEWQYPTLALVTVQPNATQPISEAEKIFANVTALGVPSLLPQNYGSWLAAYENAVIPGVAAGGIVGVNLLDMSRVISTAFVQDTARLEKLAKFTSEGLPADVPFILQLGTWPLIGSRSSMLKFIFTVAGGAVSTNNGSATSVHPAWREAFAFIDIPIFGPNTGYTASQNATLQNVTIGIDAVLSEQGEPPVAYYNEDAVGLADWQSLYFGDNYERLLSIKKEVDPQGVFSCRRCVGSEGGY